MRQFSLKIIFPFTILFLFAALSAWAISPDPEILSLVPPSAQVLSGMRALPPGVEPESNFLLMAKDNKTDLNDFAALMGVDSAMHTHEVIFEGTPDVNGAMCMHSLLTSGRFNRDLIYKSAIGNGATTIRFRGIEVLVIEPFLRERDTFHETRWLAILDDRIALFGTIMNVAHELDRYLDHNSVEPVFSRNLGRLRKDAETWSMLLTVSKDPQMAVALQTMEAILPGPIPMGSALEFAIHFGSRIEFEYDVVMPSQYGTQGGTHFPSRSFAESAIGSSFLSPAGSDSNGSHGTLKLSREKYRAWIAEIDARGGEEHAIAK